MKCNIENKTIIYSLLITFVFYVTLFFFTFEIKPNSIIKTEGKGKEILIVIEQNKTSFQKQNNPVSSKNKSQTETDRKEKISQGEDSITQEKIETGKGNFLDSGDGNYKTQIDNYLDKRIKENLSYPHKAKIRGIQGKVVIDISISSDGKLDKAIIISSSGSKLLDDEAISLVKNIFPLPQDEIKNIALTTTISITYKLI